MIEPGTLLAGRYRVERRLGAGGMATVFLAEDERLRRKVAVKRIDASAESDVGRRIRREARLGAGLSDPGIVTVYDTIADDDALLIVMEYVPGQTLADVLAAGPLGPGAALDVLRPVAAALDHVHERGVVHRDVKPANVLLREGGGVKLADLGIATSADVSRITSTGGLVGTLAYMAPEQLEPGRVTGAADVYALAAVAFEALSGGRVRKGATTYELLQAAGRPPADLHAALPGVPEAAVRALEHGLAHDPRLRPPSASALVDELAAAFAAAPEPKPAPPRRQPAPPSRAARPSTPARAPRAVPADRRGRARRALLASAVAALAVAGVIVALSAGGGGGGTRTAGRAPRGASTPARAKTTRTQAATARAGAPPTGIAATPQDAVRAFYGRAARGDLAGAWRVAGPRMRAAFGGSLQRFRRDLGTLRSITFRRLDVVRSDATTATLQIETIARHTTRTDHCTGTLAAVHDPSAGWLVEPQGVSCTAA